MKGRWVNTNNPHPVLLDTLESTSLMPCSEKQSAGTADALCTACSMDVLGIPSSTWRALWV